MSQKINKIKTYNIEVEEPIVLFQGYITSINWMLGKKMLSPIEIDVLSYFLYYYNKYNAIDDIEIRYELLFSITTKRKIRDEFNIHPQKLEGYLSKLKKKGAIINNRIADIFIIEPNKITSLLFNFSIKKEEKKQVNYVEEEVEINYKPLPYDYRVNVEDDEEEEEYEQD